MPLPVRRSGRRKRGAFGFGRCRLPIMTILAGAAPGPRFAKHAGFRHPRLPSQSCRHNSVTQRHNVLRNSADPSHELLPKISPFCFRLRRSMPKTSKVCAFSRSSRPSTGSASRSSEPVELKMPKWRCKPTPPSVVLSSIGEKRARGQDRLADQSHATARSRNADRPAGAPKAISKTYPSRFSISSTVTFSLPRRRPSSSPGTSSAG